MSAVAKALKLIKDEEVEYVDIRFTDPKGKLQHVTLVSDLVDGPPHVVRLDVYPVSLDGSVYADRPRRR